MGIAYNPITLSRQLSRAPASISLFAHQSRWRSLDHHSELSAGTPEGSRQLLEQARSHLQEALDRSRVLLLTLGTSMVYESVHSGRVAANCHRLAQSLFTKRRLTVEESEHALRDHLKQWLEGDEQRRVLLSVSPVRYLRQGLVENARSKAVLLLTADTLCRSLPRTEYFPAFEILTDELRDYRFYDEDLAQPSSTALKIVWDRFCRTYFTEEDRDTLCLIQRVLTLAAHRHGTYTPSEKLALKGNSLLDELKGRAPGLDLTELRARFRIG